MGVTIQRDMLDAARMLPEDQGRDLVYALVAYGLDGELPDDGEPWYPMFHVCRDRVQMSAEKSAAAQALAQARWSKKRTGDADEDAQADAHDHAHSDADNGAHSKNDGCAPMRTHDAEVSRGEDEVRMSRGEESSKRIESGTDDGGSPLPDGPVPYGAIVGRLNQRAGADYRPSSRATRRLIDARWREGYRLPDFEAVVDAKCSEWAGTEMAKYLRPQTLFGTKFESYRSQALMGGTGGGAPDGWYDFASLDAE